MFRKFVIATFALLICLMAAACAKKADPDVPEGMKQASSEIAGYKLYVPEDWVVDMSTGVTSAYVSVSDASNVSVIVASLKDPNITPAQYWESYKTQYTETFPDLEELDTANVLLGGKHAEAHTFTASMMETKYKFKQVVAIFENNAYLFTYTAKEELFDTHLEEVNKMIEHFRFES